MIRLLESVFNSFHRSWFAFSNRAADALVLDFFELKIHWQADAGIVVPHLAKVTAEHQRSILGLSANAEKLLVMILDLKLVEMENLFDVLNRPNFEDGLGKSFPV